MKVNLKGVQEQEQEKEVVALVALSSLTLRVELWHSGATPLIQGRRGY
jgi:hypothetical protein